MKKLIYAAFAACCLLAAQPSAAQRSAGHRPKSAEEMAKFRTERMTEQLKLDEVQQQQIYRINLEFAQQMRQLHADRKTAEGAARQDDREKMQELQASYDARIKKNLSREQYDKWSKSQERHRGAHGRQGAPDGRRARHAQDKR